MIQIHSIKLAALSMMMQEALVGRGKMELGNSGSCNMLSRLG